MRRSRRKTGAHPTRTDEGSTGSNKLFTRAVHVLPRQKGQSWGKTPGGCHRTVRWYHFTNRIRPNSSAFFSLDSTQFLRYFASTQARGFKIKFIDFARPLADPSARDPFRHSEGGGKKIRIKSQPQINSPSPNGNPRQQSGI